MATATVGFAVAAVAKPSALSGEPDTAGQRYYARMYAARALPLAVATLAAVAAGAKSHEARWAQVVLALAATAQVGDAAVGIASGKPGQVVAPLLGAAAFAARATVVP
ncbi:MAG: hypothetical protein IPK37_10430 [Austwickia sp.]|nr:MAG: hypothetical protein IPK37_10430 [Austwickia sp.]